MKKWMCGILSVGCMLSGCQSDSSDSSSVTPEEASASWVSQMDIREQIAQMLIVDFREWEDTDCLEMNEDLASMLRDVPLGGVILFSENLDNTDQTTTLIHEIQAAHLQSSIVPLLIGVDQEGGIVTRLAQGTSMPGNMALGAIKDPTVTQQSARIIGQELKALGFNTDFAPSLDVNSNPNNPIIGLRSFSSDPQTVATLGVSYMQGMRDAGVLCAIKHFPGHGDTQTDSHTGLPQVNRSLEELQNHDLIPFQQAIQQGADLLMTAHIQFPQVEFRTYTSIQDGSSVYLPATLSHTILTDLLRNQMGYQGVIVTDSFQMGAIVDHFSKEDAAMFAINAGADMLLMPVAIHNVEDIANLKDYISMIEGMVNSGLISADQIRMACERILAMKIRHGFFLDSLYNPSLEEKITNAESIVGSPEHHAEERAISDAAITLLKNENGLLPLDPQSYGTVVFVCPEYSILRDLQFGWNRLVQEGTVSSGWNAVFASYNFGKDQESMDSCLEAIEQAQEVVLVSSVNTTGQLAEEGSRSSALDEIQGKCEQLSIPTILLSCGNPYDVARFPSSQAILVAYGNMGTQDLNEQGLPVYTYGPNLPASLDILFGKVTPTGKLPVEIPSIEGGQFTSDVAYPLGSGSSW